MAIVIVSVSGSSPAKLAQAVNAALAPLTGKRILCVDFDGGDAASNNTLELAVTITYETGVASTVAYQCGILQAKQASEMQGQANAVIAANPGYFWAPLLFAYTVNEGMRTAPYYGLLIYNTDLAQGYANWGGSGGAPAGAVGGDLAGTLPNPTVVGLRGVPLSATPITSGQTYVYDATTGKLVPSLILQYYVSGAAAAATAPHVNGTFVVISPGSPTSEAGTYQVSANGGAAFPADYTKISDTTDTASEVGIVDVGNFYTSTNVEGALQELGPLVAAAPQAQGALPNASTTVMDQVAVATYGAVDWEIELVNGTQRYQSSVHATTDGATATGVEDGIVIGPGVVTTPFTIDVDVSAGNLRLTAALTAPGWSYRVRRLLLTA